MAANSLGGTHNGGKPNHNNEAEELRRYMETGGAQWFGRSMPSAFVFEIPCCTLRACEPLAANLPDWPVRTGSERVGMGRQRKCKISTFQCNVGRHSLLRRMPSRP